MSRAYLAEWVRQLCGGSTATQDVDALNAAELTRLVVWFSGGEESTEATV